MSNRLFFIIGLCLTLIGFYACGESGNQGDGFTETVEIFTVKEEKDGSGKGNLIYREEIKYKKEDQPEWRKFFEKDGSLRGKEIYQYEIGSDLPTGSKYFDGADSLLSTYTFVNENGNRVRTISSEAATDQILRIEEFAYNNKGHRTQQVIKEADMTVNRTYKFQIDKHGNEKAMTVLDGTDEMLYQIDYTITKMDDQNRWTEVWGFRNDKPEQVKYRTFTND